MMMKMTTVAYFKILYERAEKRLQHP